MDITTVGELADFLATQPRDRKVVLSRDAEGNGYSLLAAAVEAMYDVEEQDAFLTPEELAAKADPDEWGEAPEDAERVVLLEPV